MTSAAWTNPVYEAVSELIRAHAGLVFPLTRRSFAEAGIQRAMTQSGITDVGRYFDHLRLAEGRHLDTLIAELTVGETYFFREPAQFEFIRREVLPAIKRSRDIDHRLRAWSAGCATGEEAYSLAILFEQEGIAADCFLLATDISQPALARAREASYGAWSLRGGGQSLVQRYLQPRGQRYVVAERFRERVVFRRLNLARDGFPSEANGTAAMDLILCRNVLIYLDREAVGHVAERLFASLADGGWLITGPSDPILPHAPSIEAVATEAGIFYRRALHQPVSPARPRPAPNHAMILRARPTARHHAARRRVPRDPLGEAREALARGDHRGVLELTQEGVGAPESSILRARALANLGDAASAEAVVGAAAVSFPLLPALHFLRALFLVQLDRHEEAAQAVRRVIYLDPTLALGYLMLGAILQRLGKRSEARRAYRNGHALLSRRPPDEIVALSDDERASTLLQAAAAQLAALGDPLDGAGS